MKRRTAMAVGLSASIGGLLPISIGVGQERSALTIRDKLRFRLSFKRALWRQHRDGVISGSQYRHFWMGLHSNQQFTHGGNTGSLLHHLEASCEQIARKSGSFVDDISKWWNQLVAWLIENWDVVLRVLLTLVVFLEPPRFEP